MSHRPDLFRAAIAAVAVAVLSVPVCPARDFGVYKDDDESGLIYTTSWLGNSLGRDAWVQKNGVGLAVAADGTCVVPDAQAQRNHAAGFYRAGRFVGRADHVSSASSAVAADHKYAFVGTSRWEVGKKVYGLKRFQLNGTEAPWQRHKNFIGIGPEPLIAVYLHAGELYMADPASKTLRIYNSDTMVELERFDCEGVDKLAVSKDGKIWVLRGMATDTDTTIVEYARDGTATGRAIGDVPGATAIAFDPAGVLLVAGVRHQVLRYDVGAKVPARTGALGAADGVWSGTPGEMADDKLVSLIGVGADAEGNIYTLGQPPTIRGGVDLRSFAPDGTLRWHLVANQWGDVADADAASDGVDVYTLDEHFVLDLAKEAGSEPTCKGYTVDPALDDGRLNGRFAASTQYWTTPMIRRVGGQTLMYVVPGPYFGIFRKDKGEIFKPSGLLKLSEPTALEQENHDWPPNQPVGYWWGWRDANGNGLADEGEYASDERVGRFASIQAFWADDVGGLWLGGQHRGESLLWHWPMAKQDDAGNPVYAPDSLVKTPVPEPLVDIRRIDYDAAGDVMILAGSTWELRTPQVGGNPAGAEIVRFDNWSKPEREVRWRIVLPFDMRTPHRHIRSIAVAGERVFAIEFYRSLIHVYDAGTGRKLGVMSPGEEVAFESSWCNIDYGMQAFQRKNGEYLVFAEDDLKCRVLMYRLPPEHVVKD